MLAFTFKKPCETLVKFVHSNLNTNEYHWFCASKDMEMCVPLDKSKLKRFKNKPTRIFYCPKNNEIENLYYNETGQYLGSNKVLCK
jgi:hypothetical protein